MKSNIIVSDVLEYYKTHSKSSTCKKFHIGTSRLSKLLESNDIIPHTEQENSKLTFLEKYGVENPFQLTDKIKESYVKKDGSVEEHYRKVSDAMKKTNLEKYGVTCSLHNEDIEEKTKQTCLERYGTEYYFASDDAKNKIALAKDAISEKSKQTCIERYGTEYPWQSEEIKYKIKKSVLNKYGVEYFCLSPKCRAYNKESTPNKEFREMLVNAGLEFESEFPLGNKAFDFKIENVLIEINPTPTHNSTYGAFNNPPMARDYHKNKTQIAVANGFRCVHIWDWDDKDKILRLLFNNSEMIYARECSIKVINANIAKEFLLKNHLQGYAKSDINIGLYYQDNLVSIMTFGKPRYNKKYQYELVRYCSNTRVIGGSEKLFKYFIKNYSPESIISYCDLSKFTGDVYDKLGFTLLNNPSPSKHWYNLKTKQHITDNLLRQRGFDQLFKTDYGKGTSNEKLMLEHGFVEIYDAGQATYVYVN